jgi:phosphatidylinositol kinase/protein kinase (PI-3  family)
MEGIFSTYLRSISDAFTTPKDTLSDFLGIFLHDDLLSWTTSDRLATKKDWEEQLQQNVNGVLSRAKLMSNVEDNVSCGGRILSFVLREIRLKGRIVIIPYAI